MKKIIAIVLALVTVLSVASVCVGAVTKADLLVEAAKSPIYGYVGVALENAARTIEITDEQAAEILPIVKKACTIVGNNKYGHGGFFSKDHGKVYTDDQLAAVMTCIDEVCRILGCTYTTVPSKNSKHVGDSVFMVYNEQGKLVFEYDGDIVDDTAAATTENTALIIAGASVILVLGLGAVVVSKRRLAVK